jgi:protein involved in polysaccharide export with SLBB domain
VFDGDLIFVPRFENNRVFVMGEVSSPGVVPIGLGLTATEAIARSGGFTNIARRNDIKLVRGGIENPNVIEVPVWNVAKKGHREDDVPLRNGDILFIPRSPIGSLNILLTQIIPPLQTWLLIQAISN